MEKKSKHIREYSSDEQEQNANNFSSRNLSKKKRRSSRIPDQYELISNFQQPFRTNSNLCSISTSQKRTRGGEEEQEDDDYYFPDDESINKRIRFDQTNSIESENEPPRATIKRRSLFLYHPNELNSNLSSSTFFNQFLPSFSSSHSSEQNLSNSFPLTFENESFLSTTTANTEKNSSTKINKHCFTSQSSNHSSPLRTTSFVFDSKQQTMSATILRTGNISPAHSDTSTESTSTCSSDEQQFHPNLSFFHYQSSRSSRERENYEQLLNLAEKLADPNRLNQVDIEQFFSYRYKSISSTDLFSSKQTACVICMSTFKNGQRIRVLPCQHEYHTKCIGRWFTMNSSCPICRRDNFSLD